VNDIMNSCSNLAAMPAPKFSGSAEIAFLTDWGLAPLLKLKKTPWLLPPLPAWQLVI
jgi:hypothetical protein